MPRPEAVESRGERTLEKVAHGVALADGFFVVKAKETDTGVSFALESRTRVENPANVLALRFQRCPSSIEPKNATPRSFVALSWSSKSMKLPP